MKRQGEVEVQV